MKNSKISTKIVWGFSLVMVLALVFSLSSMWKIIQVGNLSSEMYEHPFASNDAVLKIDGDVIAIHRAMKDVAMANNKKEIDDAVAKVDEYEKHAYDQIKVLEEKFLGDKGMVSEVKLALDGWKAKRDKVIGLARQGQMDKVAAAIILQGYLDRCA